MRPSAIPDEEVPAHATRRVIAPPDGDLTGDGGIEPVEALTWMVDGTPYFSVRMVLDDLDVQRIKEGERVFWYHQMGQALRPFQIALPTKIYPVCRNCHGPLAHDRARTVWFHEHPQEDGCRHPDPIVHPPT